MSIPYPKDTTTEEVNKQEKEFVSALRFCNHGNILPLCFQESEALDVIKRSKLQAQELRKEVSSMSHDIHVTSHSVSTLLA